MTKIWKQPTEVFYKKGALKKFSKFTGKLLCQSLLFNKISGLSKFLRTPFLQNTSSWLLLIIKTFCTRLFLKKKQSNKFLKIKTTLSINYDHILWVAGGNLMAMKVICICLKENVKTVQVKMLLTAC